MNTCSYIHTLMISTASAQTQKVYSYFIQKVNSYSYSYRALCRKVLAISRVEKVLPILRSKPKSKFLSALSSPSFLSHLITIKNVNQVSRKTHSISPLTKTVNNVTNTYWNVYKLVFTGVQNLLYHKELGIPRSIRSQIRQTGQIVPTYSQHAQTSARLRGIVLPRTIDYTKCEPFEIETKRDGTVIKVVYRTGYPADTKCDLILVVHPEDNFVRTVWLNQRDDNHTNLRISNYEQIAQGV